MRSQRPRSLTSQRSVDLLLNFPLKWWALLSEEMKKEWGERVTLSAEVKLAPNWVSVVFGWMGQRGVTINGTIYMTPHWERLAWQGGNLKWMYQFTDLAHELYHVNQQRNVGWGRFLWRYMVMWPSHWRRQWEHPFEVPAYRFDKRVWKRLQDMEAWNWAGPSTGPSTGAVDRGD